MDMDLRWKQRLQNYKRAFAVLEKAVELANTRELTDLEKQGLIQGFEFTFELAWNVMKDYLEEQGIIDIVGSKAAVRNAYKNGIIDDGQIWMDMIESRNISSHSYDEETANKILMQIINSYFLHFQKFLNKMEGID
jgi:nucleotidyltransferase substrate binding protein (TIGR01987 family)